MKRLLLAGYALDATVAAVALGGCNKMWQNYPYYGGNQGGGIVFYILLFVHSCAAPFVARHLITLELPRAGYAWLVSPLPLLAIVFSAVDTTLTFV